MTETTFHVVAARGGKVLHSAQRFADDHVELLCGTQMRFGDVVVSKTLTAEVVTRQTTCSKCKRIDIETF